MGIDAVNLGRIDLNLLVHLDALLADRSVTRAAARAGIGQSAMSHNLARLRELFGDELLTRGAEGMRLTPRAGRCSSRCGPCWRRSKRWCRATRSSIRRRRCERSGSDCRIAWKS
jgi:DNA-binding transcriptional LysR family regulator